MHKTSSIKNLIFDLGGVILDLSVDKSMQAFSTLSGIEKQKVNELYAKSSGFEAYEMGLTTDQEFREFVRDVFSVRTSDGEIDACWNAMLLGLPVAKLNLLKKLRENYTVYLLSNTNNIHLNYINQIMLPATTSHEDSLDRYFHRAYYSHIMKKRKPNADIFEQVLRENSLQAHETLFLDDNLANVEGAKQLGIQTVHVNTPDLILSYFK